MKNKNHDKVIKKWKQKKEDQLEDLASNLLEKQKLFDALKEKKIKGKFLDLF
jgi:hypothetical protein